MPQSQMVTVFQNTVRLLVTKYPEDLKSPAVRRISAANGGHFAAHRDARAQGHKEIYWRIVASLRKDLKAG